MEREDSQRLVREMYELPGMWTPNYRNRYADDDVDDDDDYHMSDDECEVGLAA